MRHCAESIYVLYHIFCLKSTNEGKSARFGNKKRAPQKCASRRLLYILVIRTFTERADSRVKEDKGDWDWIEVTCLFGEMPFQAKTSLC